MAIRRMLLRVQHDHKRGVWGIRYAGKLRELHHYQKASAVSHGRYIAKRCAPSRLIIHRKDGSYQTECNYG